MISYSQNQEDVVLSRLTRFVQDGVYVDVGAGHPIGHNVTYALYLQNWRGVNVEPMQREAALLRETRPEDVTLQTAVSNFEGRIVLFEAPLENRGSTTSDPDLVRSYRDQGQQFHEVEVDVCTLTTIFETHVTGECHILKIDVEGSEREVLQGFDLSRFRPWVIVIEATLPQSTVDCSSKWQDILFDAGYSETLFDGLNKFYVRNDLEEIAEVMSVPANVFDNWKTFEVNDLTIQAIQLQNLMTEMHENYLVESETFKQTLADVNIYVQSLIERADHVEAYAKSLEQRLNS